MKLWPPRAPAFYRRLSLTTKMVVLGAAVGGGVWGIADQIEHDVLGEVLLKELSRELTFEAQRDREFFNGYIEDFSAAAKLVVSQKRFIDYIAAPAWRDGGGALLRHEYRPPEWMPKSSVLRSFFSADQALLLDADGEVREVYNNRPLAEGEPGLPPGLLRPSPLLRKLSHNQAYLTSVDDRYFLLSAQSAEVQGRRAATLLLVSSLDNELLKRVRDSQESHNVLVLIDRNNRQVVASSRPELVAVGAPIENYQREFLLRGKGPSALPETSFFDYGASDLHLAFVSLVPLSEVTRLVDTILNRSKLQHSALAGSMVLLFLAVIAMVTYRMRRLSRRVEAFSVRRLGVALTGELPGDEVDALYRRFEMLTEAVLEAQDALARKERLATLGQLTSTVSHELRNPLGAMRPALYILKKKVGGEDKRIRQAVERIERNVQRCDHIIDELLDFTRVTELQAEPMAIDPWLESLLAEQSLPAGIAVESRFGLEGVVVPFDPYRLRRAVINVVENAAHAMLDQANGELTVDQARLEVLTRAGEGRWEIVVTDNGIGIPDDVLPKIFVPLYSTKGFGIGLGMPTVKQVMELHGGGIEIDTEEGWGTRVTLWLPWGGGEGSDGGGGEA